MNIYEIKSKIPELLPRVARVARMYGHPYKRGLLVAKNWIVLAVKQLLGFKSDEKVVDDLWENGIAAELGFKRKPDPSLLSKARKYADDGALKTIYEELARDECKGKLLRLIAQDSKDIPVFYVKKDRDADLGVRTSKRREQEIKKRTGKDEREKTFFIGYKLHPMIDAESGLPLTAIVLPASIHDSQPFYPNFNYVASSFRIQHGGKFLGDSAFDATTIRQRVRDRCMKDVIAVNGRGHYPSETPKDPDYGKRWLTEQLNSRLDMVYNLTVHRMKGIKRITVHAFCCLLANFVEYFMN